MTEKITRGRGTEKDRGLRGDIKCFESASIKKTWMPKKLQKQKSLTRSILQVLIHSLFIISWAVMKTTNVYTHTYFYFWEILLKNTLLSPGNI